MTFTPAEDLILPDVLVPISLIESPEQVGGTSNGDCIAGDLVFRDGQFHHIQPTSRSRALRLVLPKLTECHVHLDKCHTISRIAGVGGDLRAAILKQEIDKRHWTEEDVRQRAMRGLHELIEAGCRNVRSHLDWTTTDGSTALPHSWHVLNEIAQAHREQVSLQLSPLIGIDQYRHPGFAHSIARQLAKSGGVLGAFVFDQADRRTGIEAIVTAADSHGLALDFHVDEGLSDGLDGLEIIADTVIETGYEGPVLCSHACSLMNLDTEDLKRLGRKLVHAGITIASLPVTNLYLQGRNGGTPDRRGITRIRELREMGVSVVVGTDNVRDAFCPIGQHNSLQTLMHAVLAAHLDPPFGRYLPMISTTAESALGLSPTWIDSAGVDDLVIFDVSNISDLLSKTASPKPLSSLLQGEPA